jgi:hypothetical protein
MKPTRFVGVLTLGVLGPASLSAGPADAARSTITSVYIDLKKACTKIDGPAPSDDNQDWVDYKCGKPVGGWQVFVSYGDIRENVTLKRNGVVHDLSLWTIHGAPSTMGPTFEFRTKNGQPYAAVMRHILDTANDREIAGSTQSQLMVAKLRPKPCIVADIDPGPNQSALARAAADRAPSMACLSPSS